MESEIHLREFLSHNGWPLAPEGHHHARPGWLNFDCPYCGTGTHGYHMGYRVAYAYVNCWRCGRRDLIQTLELISRSSKGDGRAMAKLLRGTAPRRDPKLDKTIRPQKTFKPPRGLLARLMPAHRQYLERDRGFDADALQRDWEIGAIGPSGRHLAWRVYIPFYYLGEPVTYTTRAIVPGVTRYLSCEPADERLPIKSLLYGIERTDDHAILALEGPTDVWRFGWGAAAVCGLQVSPPQIEQLSRFTRRVICFDSTPAAQRRAKKLAHALSIFPGETIVAEVDAEDVGSASEDEIIELKNLLRP